MNYSGSRMSTGKRKKTPVRLVGASIESRYPGRCGKCAEAWVAGDRIYSNPGLRGWYCSEHCSKNITRLPTAVFRSAPLADPIKAYDQYESDMSNPTPLNIKPMKPMRKTFAEMRGR